MTTDWEAILWCLLCHGIHNNKPMLPSEETLLMTASILWGRVIASAGFYFFNAAKDILQTLVSIAVQAMVFNDQENVDNEAAGQTLTSN